MKITAEFNSNEELLSFIGAFGTKSFKPEQGSNVPVNTNKANNLTEIETKDSKVGKPQEDKNVPKVNAEVVEVNQKTTEIKDVETAKDEASKGEESPKITKEMVREVFTKIIKAGKQKEAKALTEKYGATRLPDLKEEHYAAVYKEAEALL